MKKVKGNDVFDRINYLYQAANLAMKTTTPNNSLVEFYGSCIKKIAAKNVLKLDPSIKRNLCKKCNIILVPSVTLKVRLKGKREKHVVHTCLNCGFIKRYMERSKKSSKIEQTIKMDSNNPEENSTS
uniref:Uncharacterized protein n=1 Tax=Strigamia maritima TaxID=126957 RepID=T1IXM5_STRMM